MKDGNYVILIVEDDPKLRESMAEFLRSNQYIVKEAEDGEKGLELFYAANHEIDVILLDVMLPGISGFDVLRTIRELSTVPIIMTTAKETEEEQLEGLGGGADNYITKPFRLKVLAAHIEALLKRTREKTRRMSFGKIELDEDTHQVLVDGRSVNLTAKEFALLSFFIHNNNKVLSRDVILDSVWGYNYEGDIRTVDTLVKQLRRKLTRECPYIYSVYGYGYCFKAV